MPSANADIPRNQLCNHIPISGEAFDLDLTLDNGQVFHWEKDPTSGVWEGLVGEVPCRIFQDAAGLWTNVDPGLLSNYLGLDDPLETIEASFPADAFCKSALVACRGMRIIRQPFWECLATFICSSMKQVAHIRQIVEELRRRYGRPIPGSKMYSFPTAAALAQVPEKELRDCRLGYRAKSLRDTAQRVVEDSAEWETLHELPTSEARERLTRLPGVGPKIANCVLLFSFHRLEAVPVDVWVHRILTAMAGRKLTERELERRGEQLGPYAGYVQQYLFHHARVHGVLPA